MDNPSYFQPLSSPPFYQNDLRMAASLRVTDFEARQRLDENLTILTSIVNTKVGLGKIKFFRKSI